MDTQNLTGIYIYERKTPTSSPVLKELLQLSKTVAAGKNSGFSFVHCTSSLIPNLSLWENLQLSVPHERWEEFVKDMHPALTALIPLMKEPYKKASEAEAWECFLISLMKGIHEETPSLLVDMQEEIFPAFIVKTVKTALVKASAKKSVYLSSVAPSLWLDCAHHLVRKDGYAFVFEKMDVELIRRYWAA